MDHSQFLDMALDEAELGLREGASPIGSVIVAPNGTVLSRGRNRVVYGDQTAHAEVDAIRNGGAAIATPLAGGGWILYTTAEPCLMCLGAILLCPIQTVVWALSSTTGSAYESVRGGAYRHERLRAINVIREPSPAHRARSLALIDAFNARRG